MLDRKIKTQSLRIEIRIRTKIYSLVIGMWNPVSKVRIKMPGLRFKVGVTIQGTGRLAVKHNTNP